MYRLLVLLAAVSACQSGDADFISPDQSALASACSEESRERFLESVDVFFHDDLVALAEAGSVLAHGNDALSATFDDDFFLVELCQSMDGGDVDCADSDAVAEWAQSCRGAVGPWVFWELDVFAQTPATQDPLELTAHRDMFSEFPIEPFEEDTGDLELAFLPSGKVSIGFEDSDNGGHASMTLPVNQDRLAVPDGQYQLELSAHDNSEISIDALLNFHVVR